VFGPSKKRKREPESYRDEEFYMSHYQKDAATDKGYSLRDGASFVEQARGATFDLATDEAVQAQKRAGLGWDKKKKKFVAGGGAGADNVKIVRTESGTRLPASYRSGRFDEWKAKHRARLPKIGEDEGDAGRFVRGGGGGGAGTKFRHSKMDAAKPLDKLGNNYERKSRQMKKRAGDASASTGDTGEGRGGRPFTKGSHAKGVKEKTPQGRAGGRYGGKPIGRVKSELKSAEQIRKARKTQDQRKSKNARPSKRGRR
jgi:ATP-dependent RNA helicase DDX54/DBP10